MTLAQDFNLEARGGREENKTKQVKGLSVDKHMCIFGGLCIFKAWSLRIPADLYPSAVQGTSPGSAGHPLHDSMGALMEECSF